MDDYSALLEATISHLQDLKSRGVRHVTVSPGLLAKPMGAPRPAAPPARPPAAPAPLPPSPPKPAPPPAPVRAVPPPSVVIIRPPSGDKVSAMQELRDRAMVCQKCPNLAATRQNVVFGVGSLDAELMFIGEAPGADEDAEGEPFVGAAGQTLTKMIGAMGLSRDGVYIANILKCRPDTPNQSSGNRPPTNEEMARCLPYLHAQIDIIQPKVIVALGGIAMEGLFGKVPGIGITKLRGRWREYRSIPVMPTYHPSYLMRANATNVKRQTWEDMLQVMDRLNMPISEKQRGYFLAKS